jgi:dihydrofolate reductase
MGKLTVTTFVTLDGVMQAPGGPEEDPTGGFRHEGWLVPHFDDALGAFMGSLFARAEAFLLGRGTYDIFANHWPRVNDPSDPIATGLNSLPKHVVSRTLPEASWNNSTVIRDLRAAMPALKERYEGELQVHGSAGLVQDLFARRWVDELNLITFPVVLGHGKRLFGDKIIPTTLELLSSQTTPAGTILATYRPLGAPTYGSFMLPQEGCGSAAVPR